MVSRFILTPTLRSFISTTKLCRVRDDCRVLVSVSLNWMTSNRLKMNSDKIDLIWLGSTQQLAKLQHQSVCLNGVNIPVSAEVTCLGVLLDSRFTFTPHVQCLARRCFYYLRQIRTVRRSLITDSTKSLVHALIARRLDYCNNVLYYRINTSATKILQSVLTLGRTTDYAKTEVRQHYTDNQR